MDSSAAVLAYPKLEIPMKTNTNWWEPNNLQKIESQERRQLSELPAEQILLQGTGDFHLYSYFNRSGEPDWGKSNLHGVGQDTAPLFAQSLLWHIGAAPRTLLDVGCGLGLTTEALRKVTGADCSGLEMSQDAIDFAKRTFNKCHFETGVVSSSYKFTRAYDWIVAREFYPFSRAQNFESMFPYVEVLLRGLNPYGRLIIVNDFGLKKSTPPLNRFIGQLRRRLSKTDFKVEQFCGFRPKIQRLLGTNWMSYWISIGLLRYRESGELVLVIQKKS